MADTKAERGELVRRMLARSLTHDSRLIPPRPAGTDVALTPVQAGIWFAAQLFPDSPEYNVFDVLPIARRLKPSRVTAAARALIERHDVLRVSIASVNGKPRQRERPPFTPEVGWHDLSSLAPRDAEREAKALSTRCARALLGAEGAELFRLTAIAMPGERTLVVLVMHHVITDFVTGAILLEELAALLLDVPLPPPPKVGFLDYAAWESGQSDPSRIETELAWWLDRLSGDLPRLEVPHDRPRPLDPSRNGYSVAFTIPAETVERLRTLAAACGTTMFVVFLAVYYLMLARLSGMEDLIVGTGLLGREHAETERMAGCFVRTVALRTAVNPAASFFDLVAAAHRTLAEAQDHREVTFERIVQALRVPRELGVHPVFQTYFGYLSMDRSPGPGNLVDPTAILDYSASKWDMSLSLWETGGGIEGIMESSTDLFEPTTIQMHRDLYLRLCTAAAADPGAPTGRLPLVSDAERERLACGLTEFIEARIPFDTLTEPFERQTALTPDAVAVQTDTQTVSYLELERWSGRVAAVLHRHKARRVALVMDRSVEMLVAIYAIARSGATYVPLDPEIPASRLAMMIEDTVPELVIADPGWRDRVPDGPWQVVSFTQLDELAEHATVPADGFPVPKGAANPSHLLYTSGSTGRPKAVICTVATALADIMQMQQSLRYGPSDAILFKTSYGFDSSLWEIFWPLFTGARIVVCPPGDEKDPVRLAAVIERHQVTVVDLTPTVLHAFLEELQPGRCTSLRYLHTGGELVTPAVRDSFRARSRASLINGYGPTETGCMAHAAVHADTSASVPVGQPHGHARIRILNESGELTPVGVPGEAYIASASMAHGYLNRPGLTADRFLPDPFGPPGSRMYRTGDLCRLRPDGSFEVLGRIDDQVKIRGLRVELGEVESVLSRHPDVAECAVVTVGAGADIRIAAFVRPRAGHQPDPHSLREHAARELPRHMVPSTVRTLERIPVTVNGKADRPALRRMWRPEDHTADTDAVPPANAAEARLAEIFAEILGLSRVGVTDNFFDLGGHSLLVFRLVAACEARLGFRPRVADVFAAPSVRLLAERLRRRTRAETAAVPLTPRPGRPVVLFVHAVSGSATPFGAIAEALGTGYSCYGLQGPEPIPGQEPPSIAELGASYAVAADAIRGMSPVYIVGWSMGGCIATEMARLWRCRGFEVSGLLLLDCWLPPQALPDGETRLQAEQALLAAGPAELEGIAWDAAPDELARLRQAAEANIAASLDYAPEPLAMTAHILRATDPITWLHEALPEEYLSPSLGWTRVFDVVEVHQVPGSHDSMVRAEHTERLASVIRGIFEADDEFGEL